MWLDEIDRLIHDRRYAEAINLAWEPPSSERLCDGDYRKVYERLFVNTPLFLQGCQQAIEQNRSDLLNRWHQGFSRSKTLPAFLRFYEIPALDTSAGILACARAAFYAKEAAKDAREGTIGRSDALLCALNEAQEAACCLDRDPASTRDTTPRTDPATIRDQIHWPTLHPAQAIVDGCYRLLCDGQEGGVGVAQAWELTAALLGRPRPSVRSRTLWALATRPGSSPEGFAVKITVDLVDEGSGAFYADPSHLAFATLGKSFQRALSDAWQYARTSVSLPAGSDVRWRMKGPSLSTLDGNSIGGAMAVILQALLEDRPVDDRCAVAAAVTRNGNLSRVGEIKAKVRAAEQAGLRLVIVHPDNLNEATSNVAESFLQVRGAFTVAGALPVAAGLIQELIEYYERLIESLDRTPWYRRGELIRVSQVAIPVRVLKEDTRPPRPPIPGQEDDDKRSRDPARALIDPEIAHLYEEPMGLTRREELPWVRELPKIERAIVIGSPGGGKSFLTETTAIKLAEDALTQLQQHLPLDSVPLPVYLELSDLAKEDLPPDLADALITLINQRYTISEWLNVWVRERLTTRHCWLILDALDQVDAQDRDRLRDRLKAIETRGWPCRIILTCRTANYDRALVPWRTLTEYELVPFRPREIRQLIGRWFWEGDSRGQTLRDTLDRSFSLSHACRNPLILTLTCLAHEEGEVTVGTRRTDLYARVLRGLAQGAWKQNPLPRNDHSIDDLLCRLESVGRSLFELRPASNQFTYDEVMKAIAIVLGIGPLAAAVTELRDKLCDRGILVSGGLGRDGKCQFSFLHRSFLEYLTACSLAQQGNGEGGWEAIKALVDRKAWDPAWQEVIVLLAGRLHDPISVLRLLSDPNRDDHFRHRLCLAAQTLSELSLSPQTSPLLQTLSQQIAKDVFKFWWNRGDFDLLHVSRCLPTIAGSCPAAVLPIALRSLDDSVWAKRELAAEALGRMGEAAAQYPEAIAKLGAALDDTVPGVRLYAAEALGRMGEAAAAQYPAVIPRLVQVILDDTDPGVRLYAAEALGRMGEAAAQYPEVIVRLLVEIAPHDSVWSVRWHAAEALRRLMAQGVRIFKDRGGRWEWHSVRELSRGEPDLPTVPQ